MMEKTASIIGKRSANSDEIQVQVDRIIKQFNPDKIILFGSYASGKPTCESDIDLLIIMKTKQPTKKMSSEIGLSLDHKFPIDIIVKTPEEINKRRKLNDFFIEEILNNGKVIYERSGKRMGG